MPIHSNNETKKIVDMPTLTKDEIVWLMNLIKEGTFKGRDVQTVYETVVKLQLMLNKQ
jgi:hypothetical protein